MLVLPVRRLTSIVSLAIRPEWMRRKLSLPMNRSLVVLKTWATSSPSSCGSSSTSSSSVLRAVAVDVGRGQAAIGEEVEQLLDADVLARREADDRDELALGDRAGAAASRSSAAGERLAFEVAVHQVVVGLDDLLDDHLVGLGRDASGSRRGRPRAGSATSMMPEKRGPLADRHEERHALGAEASRGSGRGRGGSRRCRRPSWSGR